MRSITKPNLDASVVFSDCVSVVQSENLRQRLTACAGLIEDAEEEFERKITRGRIHTIAREDRVNGNVSVKEFMNLYTGRMVGNPLGRIHYDKLLLSAPNGLCPLCGHRDVSTLDHYLPKSKYPRLSVVPINLVPSCKDCNTGKLVDFPVSPETETLHPYFDRIGNQRWLSLTVNKTTPLSVTYSVVDVLGSGALIFERIREHFKAFGLQSLYATQAARELTGIKLQLTNIFDNGAGFPGVQRFLRDSAESRSIDNLNSWQAVLYEGLANDDWFCRLGFRTIA